MSLKIRIMQTFPHWALLGAINVIEKYNNHIRFHIRKKFVIPPLESLDLLTTKCSDTVFILGSGSSLNQISEQRWKHISQCDSFGFNFTLRHPFIPTHFFFEPHYTTLFNQILRFIDMRKVEYESVIKIILPGFPQPAIYEQQFKHFPEEWHNNLFAGGVYRTFARNETELIKEIKNLIQAGAFDAGRGHVRAVFKHMGSVTSLMSVAAIMQYKNIVLCGIDITNPAYFYDDPELYPDLIEYRAQFRKSYEKNKRPQESIQAGGDLVIMELQRQVLEPAGINLYVENSSSGLYPRLPVVPPEILASNLS